MSTPEFELHRSVVIYSDPANGKVDVKLPGLMGSSSYVSIPTDGLEKNDDGTWIVPSVGETPYVAVALDRTKFFWVGGIGRPDHSYIGPVDSIQFNTDANVSVVEGQVTWNEDEGTLDLGMHRSNVVLQIGQEVVYYVKNQTGSTISNGTVVRFDGALGASGRLKAVPFLADGTYPSEYVMGVATEDIPDGEDGYVTHFGKVRNLDTSDWPEGTILYASTTTTGALTSTPPGNGFNKVTVAAVINQHHINGAIFVRPRYAGNITNLEKVEITSLADNDILKYNSTTGLFENVQFDHGGLTGLADDDHTQYLRTDGTLRTASALKVDGNVETTAGNLTVGGTAQIDGNITLPTSAQKITWTSGTGPTGLEFSPSGTLESALYYRSSPNAWSFEDASSNAIATFDADDMSTTLGGNLDVTGNVTTDHPYFELHRSTTLSVADTATSTWTVCGWSQETADPAGLHASSNGYVTLNASGIWSFQFTVLTDSSSTNYLRQAALATNSSPTDNTTERLATSSYIATGSGRDYLHVSWVGYLATGTTVYTLVSQSSGAAVTWGVASRIDTNSFTGALICGR